MLARSGSVYATLGECRHRSRAGPLYGLPTIPTKVSVAIPRLEGRYDRQRPLSFTTWVGKRRSIYWPLLANSAPFLRPGGLGDFAGNASRIRTLFRPISEWVDDPTTVIRTPRQIRMTLIGNELFYARLL